MGSLPGTIFTDEVLKVFVHGDENLSINYPELEEALVWVYFHSNLPEFNTVECWGTLKDAVAPCPDLMKDQFFPKSNWERPLPCQGDCTCCFPPMSLIPWLQDFEVNNRTS